ncbi:hypothetical protein NUW54_g2544 [Trametes sanguinea]|uniref:Uncharacterized protein n=1 Tax=Trametes sanguinea TaxID=158606 RepID=A0ACC1Q649_9APHY|nr:hypothetical protein NUW54_g2544 [Trametes sanguinea]
MDDSRDYKVLVCTGKELRVATTHDLRKARSLAIRSGAHWHEMKSKTGARETPGSLPLPQLRIAPNHRYKSRSTPSKPSADAANRH